MWGMPKNWVLFLASYGTQIITRYILEGPLWPLGWHTSAQTASYPLAFFSFYKQSYKIVYDWVSIIQCLSSHSFTNVHFLHQSAQFSSHPQHASMPDTFLLYFRHCGLQYYYWKGIWIELPVGWLRWQVGSSWAQCGLAHFSKLK